MKFDKKQLPQIVVLGVLIVAVLGFGITRLMGTSTNAATPATEKATSNNQEANGQKEVATAKDPASPEEAQVVIAPVGPKRDPFAPVAMPSAPAVPGREDTRAAQMAEAAKSATRMARNPAPLPMLAGSRAPLLPLEPIVPNKGGLPVLPGSGRAIFRGGMPGSGASPSAFQLTGVVGGKNCLAVLRGSGEERYFVRKGDRIGGQYQVASITPHAITLSGAQGVVVIKLGKDISQAR